MQIIVGDVVGSFNAFKDAHTVYEKAASKDKHLEIFKGTTHIDLYDNPKIVDKAIEIFSNFFKKVL